MRKRLFAIYGIMTMVAAFTIMSPVVVKAQEYISTPVTVSKEKVKVGGKICYSHIVLEKQTLYSISKAYSVSIDDIYKFNPTLKETGLKKNTIILIPSAEALETPKEAPAAKQKETPVVKPKETPAVVKQTETPTAKPTEIQTVKTAETQEIKTSEPKVTKKIHVRKWYEDIDMIAAQYGVSVEAIMVANNLSSRKLEKRQKLIIPIGGVIIPETPQTADDTVTGPEGTIVSPEESFQSADQEIAVVPQDKFLFPQKEVHATMLLPMRNPEGKLSRNNMDFYSGAMLAVYDLAQEGISVDINTYDIQDRQTAVTKEDIGNSDIIIGPISTADLTRLFQTSPDCGPVVSPLDPRADKLALEYSDMIQAPTPHKVQYQDLVNWIKEDLGENDKVFMFSERIARNNEAVNVMKEVMDSSGIAYTPFSYSILEGRDVVEPLKEMMTVEGKNRIYIASESEAFVNDVVRNLNLMLYEQFEIVLYAPSKIRSFDTIEVEHFHKTSLHVSLTYYIDYDDEDVKKFLLKYRALYNTEPSQFAFQGYDIAKYFIGLCHRYGKSWPEKLETSEKEMLQSTFKFIRQGTGGYVNNGVRRIVYGPKWTVTQVK